MRLDIYISTDLKGPQKRHGSYRATWVGYNNTGKKLGEDGVFEWDYGNEYSLLVKALREAVGHINRHANPDIRICLDNKLMIQSIRRLNTWQKRGFKRTNGRPLAQADDWKYIAEKLSGLFYKVEGGPANG